MRNINLSLLALGLALLTGAKTVQAQSFAYTDVDLILGFRQSGQPDLLVNIGQASIYDAVPNGTTINITNTPSLATLLNTVYPTLNGLSWAVVGAERVSTNVTYPIQTVWVTSPRSVAGTPGRVWVRQSNASQGNYASNIKVIGVNAVTYANGVSASAISNNVTTVVIPANNPNAYTPEISNPSDSTASDLRGAFQGDVENVTPDTFDSDSPLSRSDLYEIIPDNTATRNTLPAKLVGSFNFTPDGKLTFTAGVVSSAPPAPTITAIRRTNNVTSVTFTTTASFNYSLSFTNGAGLTAPVSTWGSTGTISGNGSTQTLQHTTTATNVFYKVRAY